MYRVCLVLCIAYQGLFAAASSSTVYNKISSSSKEESTNYYSLDNLKRLKSQNQKLHTPLILLLDPQLSEFKSFKVGSVTEQLAEALAYPFAPVLVSASIIYFYYANNMHLEKVGGLPFESWDIYQIPGDPYILCLPRVDSELGKKFVVDNLNKLPHHDVDKMTDMLTSSVKAPASSPKNALGAILSKSGSNDYIWDVYIVGHGKVKEVIAGLCPDELQEVLQFLKNKLRVGFVYMESCYAGGENVDLIQFDPSISDRQALVDLNYVIILGSISDRPVARLGIPYRFFSDVGYNKPLGTIVKNINLMPRYCSRGMPVGIPQVWVPRGPGFQVYDVDEKVFVVSKAKAAAYSEESSPFSVPSATRAILLYPTYVGMPINICPYKAGALNDEIKESKHAFNLSLDKVYEGIKRVLKKSNCFEMELLFRSLEWGNLHTPIELFFVLLSQHGKRWDKATGTSTVEKDFPAWSDFLKKMNPENPIAFVKKLGELLAFVYPKMILMSRGQSEKRHFIDCINVLEPEGLQEVSIHGVMTFLRDSLVDMKSEVDSETLVDKLSGHNDLSLLLEFMRIKDGISEASELELALRPFIGKNIVLERVSILSKYRAGEVWSFLRFTLAGNRYATHLDTCKWEMNMLPEKLKKRQIDTYEKNKSELAQQEAAGKQKGIKDLLLRKVTSSMQKGIVG